MNKCEIVKRLEYCIENRCDICQMENGSGFPWIDGRCYGFTERLHDAIALLKANASRLMTLEEVKALEAGKLVWIEISGGYEGTRYKAVPAIISQIFNDAVYFYNTAGRTLHSYNRGVLGWRIWTEEPSDTQRMAVKWE